MLATVGIKTKLRIAESPTDKGGKPASGGSGIKAPAP